MERNFTDENFEEFLRRNSNSLRMRPSEKVWKNIASRLYKRRRFGVIVSVFLLTASALGYYIEHQNNLSQKPALTHPAHGNQPVSMPVANAVTLDGAYQNNEQHIAIANRSLFGTAGSGRRLAYGNVKPGLMAGNRIAARSPVSDALEAGMFSPTIVDEYEPISRAGRVTPTATASTNPEYPLSIESVFNSFQAPKKHKIGLQLTFAPTISYRKLSENKSYFRHVPQLNTPYNYAALYNVNDIVTGKPNMGFELGLNGKYALTKKINLTGGIQFNVNRYDLKVFHSYMGVATIALNTGRAIDSVRALTSYSSTNNGYGSDWLQNFFFQVSAPVGIELKLRGDDKMQFGVATTIQPTYILGDRVYLISTDYKNYAEVPWLTRHWNVNTNLETFVSYSTGHFKWQVGPQVRYQLLSSFINKYPVKENLFDFGLKIGISLNHY